MKRILAVLIGVLCLNTINADDVDKLILSFSENQRKFEWDRAISVDRQELVARLQELREGKRTTVAGGYGVSSWTAERMLIGIGDENAVREVVLRYHTRRVGPTSIADVVKLGQALAIPYLAVDLVSDEFLIYDLKRPDGQVVTVRDTHETGKRLSSARNIIGIVENSRRFPQSVRESAARIKPTSTTGYEVFIGQVADWWRHNEHLLLARRYAEVSLFEIASPVSPILPSTTSPSPSKSSPVDEPALIETAEAGESKSVSMWGERWLWMSVVALLALTSVVFWIKRR